MSTTLKTVVVKYLRAGRPARGTRDAYHTTLRKWKQWGGGVPIENLGRKEIREFLDWVYERAVMHEGTNPGRTTNKARENLRAIIRRLARANFFLILPFTRNPPCVVGKGLLSYPLDPRKHGRFRVFLQF